MKTPKLCKKAILFGLLSFFAENHKTQAELVTFTFSCAGYGSLRGITFSGTPFSVTAIADTTHLRTNAYGDRILTNLAATVDVPGIGAGSFLVPTQEFALGGFSSGRLGFSSPDYLIVGTASSTFSYYNLNTSVGPVTGTAGSANNGMVFPTTFGNFVLVGPPLVTFKAVVQPLLNITAASTNILISWFESSTNLVLETASNLDHPVQWQAVTNRLDKTNMTVSARLLSNQLNACFRLRRTQP